MEEVIGLISRLRDGGIIVPDQLEKAMRKIDINDFTQFDTSPFFNDRPVVFLETNDGGVKTISAPHMIATLLYNLELFEEQNVVVYGAKGGYICALIAHIVGAEGLVTVIDPSSDVISHLANTLRGYPTVRCLVEEELEQDDLTNLNRVLVTGQIEKLPDWLKDSICEGGFAIAPIGVKDSQNLLKIEMQGGGFFDTDLGPVLFGPVDIADTIIQTPSPAEMAEMVEHMIELMTEMELIENEDRIKLSDLVANLRQLPDDMPPPDELEDPSQHPMMKLMMEEGDWFMRFWPIVQLMAESRLASPGAPNTEHNDSSHSDFIP